MSVKMIDIAREAGVTRQTVSAVFNHPDTCRISEPVQKKIHEIARKSGYVPNITAKILKGCSSGSIGILTPVSRFGIDFVLVNEIFGELQRHGLTPQVKIVNHAKDNIDQLTRELEMRGVDGIIFCRTDDLPSDFRIPGIAISNVQSTDSDLGTDLFLGGVMATEHLIKHGKKRIAVLAEREYFCINSLRFAGWRDTMEKHGLGFDPDLMLHGGKFDHSFDRMVKLLIKLKIDALFCKNDYIGGKVINELSKRGVKIPDDIAVIGFDGMSFCDFCTVPLATVAQPVCDMAKKAVDMLMQLIKNKELRYSKGRIAMPPMLIPNASCGCEPSFDSRFFSLNTYQTIELDRMNNFGEDIFSGQRLEEKLNRQHTKSYEVL